MAGILHQHAGLLTCLCFEFGDLVAVDDVANLNGAAADFAVFNIGLTAHGCIEYHRYVFAAVRAPEEVFHKL